MLVLCEEVRDVFARALGNTAKTVAVAVALLVAVVLAGSVVAGSASAAKRKKSCASPTTLHYYPAHSKFQWRLGEVIVTVNACADQRPSGWSITSKEVQNSTFDVTILGKVHSYDVATVVENGSIGERFRRFTVRIELRETVAGVSGEVSRWDLKYKIFKDINGKVRLVQYKYEYAPLRDDYVLQRTP